MHDCWLNQPWTPDIQTENKPTHLLPTCNLVFVGFLTAGAEQVSTSIFRPFFLLLSDWDSEPTPVTEARLPLKTHDRTSFLCKCTAKNDWLRTSQARPLKSFLSICFLKAFWKTKTCRNLHILLQKLFVTFVTEVSLYSRETEPRIWEDSLNSEISQKIAQFFSLLQSLLPFCTRHDCRRRLSSRNAAGF
jgi:hypothetical protein